MLEMSVVEQITKEELNTSKELLQSNKPFLPPLKHDYGLLSVCVSAWENDKVVCLGREHCRRVVIAAFRGGSKNITSSCVSKVT